MKKDEIVNDVEQRLAATRDNWMMERDGVERELHYARRTVEALHSLLMGYDAAIASTTAVDKEGTTLANAKLRGHY
jgi:hypothetical protein